MKKRTSSGINNVRFLCTFIFLIAAGLLMHPANVKARKLKILTATGLSGPFASLGSGYDKAIRIAIDEANKKGLKNGWEGVEYKAIDSETKPSVMQQKLIREAKRWKPDIVFGAILETTIRVWNSNLPRLKIPGVVAGHQGLSKHMPPGEVPLSKWVMYYGFPEYFSGWVAGKVLHEKGAKRVGIIGGDYDWGYGNSVGLKAYWQENGKPFDLISLGYTPLDKADMTTEAIRIKRARLDGLFVAFSGAGFWSLPKALKDAKAMPRYFIYEVSYGTLGQAKITGSYGIEGVYTIADHNPETDAWKKWVKTWQLYYGSKAYPEMYSHNYYQAVNWAIKAFEELGPQVRDPDQIVDMLQRTVHQDVCISPMGPIGPYGGNMGAKASLIRFVKGADPELAPDFNIRPVFDGVYDLKKWNTKDLLKKMMKLKKMEDGEVLPAAN